MAGFQGLTTAQAADLLKRFGPNELRPEPRKSLLARLGKQLSQVLVVLLLVAAAISAVAGEWLDASAIIAIVLINATIGVFQEYRAEKSLQALKRLAAPTAKVLRDGRWIVAPARDLVPGDVVAVEAGDRVPADIRLIESANVRADESILTGESLPVEKEAGVQGDSGGGDAECLYAGTTVVYGRGRGRVESTGMSTRIGRLATTLASSPDEEPPLQRRLEGMGRSLAVAAVALIAATFAAGVFRGERTVEMLLAAVSLGVAAIPEGLPAIVTVVLAAGTQRMSARRAIVRKLAAVETLGSVTVICSDKTGTLTRNEMSVTELLAGGRRYAVTGVGYEPAGEIVPAGEAAAVGPAAVLSGQGVFGSPLGALLAGGVLANDASLQRDQGGAWEVVGDPTEGALLVVAAKAGLSAGSLTGEYPRVGEIPFDSARKLMTTVHRLPGRSGYVSITKGSPPMLLDRCTYAWTEAGIVPMTEVLRAEAVSASGGMASRALRVLAMGCRWFERQPAASGEDVEHGLTFVGLWGMMDPPRPESRAAVEDCIAAGIRPIMITGDQAATALAIARSVGIAAADARVVTGAGIDGATDEALAEIVRRSSVFAEVSPEHKSRIVHALKQAGEIVAMTGDGVNDAPALKWADIGVSMGLKGTDVAREASDMILADDNFATIVAAVEEGRIIYANIVKAIRYLLSCNFGELAAVGGAILAGLGSPLSPIQILWVNLVTDSGPAIALGMDRSEAGLLRSSRPNPREQLLSPSMARRLIVEGLVIGALGLGSYWVALGRGGREYARTVCFMVLAFSQLLHALNCRSQRRSLFSLGLFASAPVNTALAASIVLQLLTVTAPLRGAFGTVPLAPRDFVLAAAAAALVVPAAEVIKAWHRQTEQPARRRR